MFAFFGSNELNWMLVWVLGPEKQSENYSLVYMWIVLPINVPWLNGWELDELFRHVCKAGAPGVGN